MFLFKWCMAQDKEVNLEPQSEVYDSVPSSIIKNKWSPVGFLCHLWTALFIYGGVFFLEILGDRG